MATAEINLGIAEEGTLNTDLALQLNQFTVTEILNLVTHDVRTDLVIQRHLREIEPRDRLTYLFFTKNADNDLVPRCQVVFNVHTGEYHVKPDRTNPLLDHQATFEFK